MCTNTRSTVSHLHRHLYSTSAVSLALKVHNVEIELKVAFQIPFFALQMENWPVYWSTVHTNMEHTACGAHFEIPGADFWLGRPSASSLSIHSSIFLRQSKVADAIHHSSFYSKSTFNNVCVQVCDRDALRCVSSVDAVRGSRYRVVQGPVKVSNVNGILPFLFFPPLTPFTH